MEEWIIRAVHYLYYNLKYGDRCIVIKVKININKKTNNKFQ